MRNLAALILLVGCGGDDSSIPVLDAGPLPDLTSTYTGSADLANSNNNNNKNDLSTSNPGMGCGTCPSGTTCGSANGIPVCKTASGIPLFTSVFIIMMENTSMSSLAKSTNTPYLQSLTMTAAYASDYHGVTHPSLPNYIALTSGAPGVQMDGTTPVACDCDPVGATCNMCSTISTLLSKCGCEQPMAMQHLGDQLESAKKNWRAYGEGMGSACNTTSAGAYAARHVPFLYYDNVQLDATRCGDHVVDYSSFAADLMSPRALSFIAPSLDDDMHGTGLLQSATDVANGDAWLSTNVPLITASDAYKKGGVIFIAWDEDDLSGTLAKDDPIPLFVLSPFAKTGGYQSTTHADHYSMLATIEDGLQLGSRLGGAATAQPLADFFADK